MWQETIDLPSASPGSYTRLTTWRYGKEGGQKVYIQAALHADEWPGLLMLHHLHAQLEQATIRGEIVIVPYANPIGMRQFLGGYQLGRFDFDYSGNFNRGYLNLGEAALPYLDRDALAAQDTAAQTQTIRSAFKQALDAWQPQLESEHLRKTLQLLSYDADVVIDVHCDAAACAHAFTNERHQETGEALAQSLNLDVLLLEDDPGVIAFDEASASPWWRLERALDLKLPYACFSTTLELRGERDVSETLAQQDAEGVMRFLQHIGIVDGPTLADNNTKVGTPLAGVGRILAPHSGLLDFKVAAGARVCQGDVVANLIDLDDPNATPTPLTATTDGIVYALGRNHLVRPGHVVVQIAGQKAISAGTLAY
ncbi:succinylglutamate desuccinylase/aspartoacylase family protein [Suttonella sp. R2A3]|uniref:succinylglutamate desuccinylase/aspartoacylase domain-containing protein n=1 Tax=Suttonella sp. R2A3 TaxID=2908648 RepID=UPI001F46C0A1|nr:succinylglutamate desuccinylase/aspartoacylase family protein [Suttonella sp. R2A3]UJF24451.1 succinylglutamate desuccinylase/aspartoacylase family protein [Suttonella sp. R2A3]